MKTLRRSLNNKDAPNGHPPISGPLSALPPVSRPNMKTQPPKKVIRALEAYRPTAPQELAFGKGDFFHVVTEPDDSSPWYEAHNPMTGARGLVPKQLFEEFNKVNASSRASTYTNNSFSLAPSINTAAATNPPSPASPRLKTFFAIVIHDFQAERPDELDARSGDNISVVAQSNREWFVAKPIGKLGRPGLIPVAFVELKDPSTGQTIPDQQVAVIMERGDIPRVEEWKKAMVAYKAASIPLGVIDDASVVSNAQSPYTPSAVSNGDTDNPLSPYLPITLQGPEPRANSPNTTAFSSSSQKPQNSVATEPQSYRPLPFGLLVSAEVVSFHFENDEYWFRINAVWQPLDSSSLVSSGEPRRLVLFRVYDDFYDFQIQLLEAFPAEAGRTPKPGSSETFRILPYMPGPVDQVDDIVTSLRQEELDQYLGQLCVLSQRGAAHVLRHELVRQFLTCKPGDVETLWQGEGRTGSEQLNLAQSTGLDKLEELSLESPPAGNESDGSDYGYEESRDKSMPYGKESRSAIPRSTGSTGAQAGRAQPPSLQIPRSNQTPFHESLVDEDEMGNGDPSWSMNTPSTYTSVTPLNTTSSRARSNSSANTPPISATSSQTAFIKIKIFDRTSDDLIAIRVSPRVSHRQLLEKVRERLGGEVSRLNYRNSLNTGFLPLTGDDDLRSWLEQTDKHVLYAE